MKTTAVLALACTLFFLTPCFPGMFAQKAVVSTSPQLPFDLEGQILFAPMDSRTSYLIDRAGNVNHTWTSSYLPGEAIRWLGDGTILRTEKFGASGAGGSGGGVQKILWDGTVAWEYHYYVAYQYLSHHDVRALPNGNILLVAWEFLSRAEALAQGRNPDLLFGNYIWPDHIIEVQPTGPTSGDIVWEWHAWDHLIQDYDASKPNYGVVADHPELVNLNYGGTSADWLHCNSLDYNEEFDQILISCPNFNEVWVIDHSTTTEEAAGHTGGYYGHGGDLLYRWGNPQAYGRGTPSDRVFSNQHDSTWIRSGLPGAGHILVFNNGVSRHYSSVDEFAPPVDENGEYYLAPGEAYGPDGLTWSYTANPPSSFYVSHLSGAERLADGNTLICDGEKGRFFEVTPDKNTIWQYTNPYPSGGMNDVFKIVYIPPETPPETEVPDLDCSGSLQWTDVHPGATVTGSFTVQNIGGSGSLLNWTVNTSLLTWGTWTFTPASGNDLTPQAGSVTVQVSVVAPNESNGDFEGYVRVENQENASDYDLIPVSLSTPTLLQTMVQTTMPSQHPGITMQILPLRRSI